MFLTVLGIHLCIGIFFFMLVLKGGEKVAPKTIKRMKQEIGEAGAIGVIFVIIMALIWPILLLGAIYKKIYRAIYGIHPDDNINLDDELDDY